MTPNQIAALASPFVLGFATLLVHFLAPTTVAEIGTILGLVITTLNGVRNVFVVSPTTTKQLREGSLRPAPIRPPPMALLALIVVGSLACAAVNDALTAAQEICQDEVLLSSQIPPGTPVGNVSADVKAACNIADQQIPIVEQIVAAIEAAEADGGASGGEYLPSPMVKVALARKAAK